MKALKGIEGSKETKKGGQTQSHRVRGGASHIEGAAYQLDGDEVGLGDKDHAGLEERAI